MNDPATWQRIEQEAREQMRAELDVAEATPLEAGRFVAWTECRFARTDGFSVVHRVGEPMGDTPMTLCGDVVPEPIRRVILSPNLVRALGRCRYCDAVFAHKGAAA